MMRPQSLRAASDCPGVAAVADIAAEAPHVSYVRARDLLGEIVAARQGTDLESFWSLCALLWTGVGDDGAWLRLAVSRLLPEACDPFLVAFFTHDVPALMAHSEEISKFLKVVCAAPVGDRVRNVPVPPFLLDRKFRLNGCMCSGEIVWKVLTGNVSAVKSLGLCSLVAFALHFWYNSEDSDLVSAFHTFCALDVVENTKNDPILALLMCHCEGVGSFADIGFCLPAVDGYIFEHFARVFKDSSDVQLESVLMCVQKLVDCGQWPQAVAILSREGQTQRAQQLVGIWCFAGKEMMDDERRLLDEAWYDRQLLIQAKIAKLAYLLEMNKSKRDKIRMVEESIDLNMELGRWNNSHQLIFEEFIPLMTEIGENSIRRVYEWCSVLKGQLDGEDQQVDCFIIDAMSRVEAGERLLDHELEKIKERLLSRWGTFALRREMCRELLKQPDAAQYLQFVDACPKDYLTSLPDECP